MSLFRRCAALAARQTNSPPYIQSVTAQEQIRIGYTMPYTDSVTDLIRKILNLIVIYLRLDSPVGNQPNQRD